MTFSAQNNQKREMFCKPNCHYFYNSFAANNSLHPSIALMAPLQIEMLFVDKSERMTQTVSNQ